MPTATSRSSSRRALRVRDAGLRKISLTTRVLVVGSVAAAGAFSSLAAWAQPGRSKTVGAAGSTARPSSGRGAGFAPATPPNTVPSTAAPAPSESSGGDDNLAPPATPPVSPPQYTPPQYTPTQYAPPADQYSPPVVVSGAS
jgi:hypothetical protein